ncbi:uncharacterized protein LOC125940457 isoform X2 [Dermacentor silvarum]|uniref:uncharacterized protein LOC125940457 isoform X2 n=1 Tax=Dermacentor silvarum TaxID=543639 RepID=UPI002101C625|nr:uncharacterized protein LOC125940457 isoform X2 [Dermacentor silvarum]
MVKIQLQDVSQNDNLSAAFLKQKDALNGSKTLTNLIGYSSTHAVPNNTVFLLTTTKAILEETMTGDKVDRSVIDKATFGTFCSLNSSAAVIRYSERQPDNSVGQAMAEMLGSQKYTKMHTSDKRKMKEVLSQCQGDRAEKDTNEQRMDKRSAIL